MIWVGRIVSIPLGVVFFLVLLVTLVVVEFNDTFLDPDFYPAVLREANVYEFVLVDLLNSALDDRRQLESGRDAGDVGETPLITSGLSNEDIVSAINMAVPPDWVQGIVEESFDQFGRYLTGERDQFSVSVIAGEQAAIVVSEGKQILRKADAYNLLYDEVLIPRVESSLDFKLPLGVQVPKDRLVESIRRIGPPEWVQGEVEGALDEVTPYMIGDRDSFEIRVEVGSRVEIALNEVKDILRETDAYELLYSEVVEPVVRDSLGEVAQLPFGVSVTGEEAVAALRQVAPPDWVGERVDELIDDASPYLTGKVDGFVSEVSLVDNKRQARRVLAELVDRRLMEIIDGIDECDTPREARAALSRLSGGLPGCIPSGISATDVISRLGLDLEEQTESFVLGHIPDNIRFGDAQLRDALVQAGAGDNLDRLDDVREILRVGWYFTDMDLRERLGDQGDLNAERLENLRSFLSDGWTYTEARFRKDLAGDPGGGGGSNLDNLDKFRDSMKTADTYKLVVYVPLLVLLVMIAFLGGRTWTGRVAYAAGFLVVSAGIIFAIFGPGYDAFAKSGPIYEAVGISDFDELRQDALNDIAAGGGEFPNTARLAANKAFDIAESVSDDFASGVATSSIGLAIIGLIALGTAIFWGQLVGMIVRIRQNRST